MAKPKQTPAKKTPKPKKSPTDSALSIAVDPELKAKLVEIANRERRSLSYIVRIAVEQYIASQQVAAA